MINIIIITSGITIWTNIVVENGNDFIKSVFSILKCVEYLQKKKNYYIIVEFTGMINNNANGGD